MDGLKPFFHVQLIIPLSLSIGFGKSTLGTYLGLCIYAAQHFPEPIGGCYKLLQKRSFK